MLDPELFAAVAKTLPLSIVLADGEGRIVFANPRAEALYRTRAQDLRGQVVTRFVAPNDLERAEEVLQRLLCGAQVEDAIVIEMRREDGSHFFGELAVSPLYDEGGGVIGIVGMARDVTERLAAEADAARLRAIVDAAAEAILGVDASGTVLFFSPSAERLFGWPAEEIVGRPSEQLIVAEQRVSVPALFATLERKGMFRGATVAQRRDGSQVEVELSAALIRDAGGAVTGAAVTVLDVSERRRTQRLLERILQHAPNSIAVKDLDGRYMLFGERASDKHAFEAAEVVGRRDTDLLGPEVGATLEAQDQEVIERGEPMTFQHDFVGPSGRAYSYVTTKFPLPGPHGLPEAIGIIASDVSELRRAESDQAQLAALVQAAPDAIVARDREGRIVTWNPGAEAMFGVRAEEAIGRSYAELVVPEEEREAFERQTAEAQNGRTLTFRTTRKRRDGSRFPAQVSMSPLSMLNGTWNGTLAMIRDVTDLVEAERQLQARAAQLERSNTELERFAYAASHDLQEPLQSIKLSAVAVLAAAEDRLKKDECELMEHIDAAASRLSGQIRGLMQVARVALGDSAAEQVPVAVAVRDAVDALHAAAAEADAEINVDEPLPDVLVPHTETSLVLQNVIANAIKYHREGVPPRVEVVATADEHHVEIRVSDNGVGLSKDDLTRVFGLFERGPTEALGTGLGLAVARRMIERLGGTLDASSPGPGRGSVFTLWVPAR